MNFLNDKKPEASVDMIKDFESTLSQSLPADYKAFRFKHNGGTPAQKLLHIKALNEDVLASDFLGIKRPDGDIEEWITELEDDLKGTFLPIAFDPGGNAFLLDIKKGSVYYWDSARSFPKSN